MEIVKMRAQFWPSLNVDEINNCRLITSDVAIKMHCMIFDAI